MLAASAEVLELKKEYVERFTAKYGAENMSGNADLGFSGAWVLFSEVLPKAASEEPDDVKAALMSVDLDYGSTILDWGVQFDATGQNTRTLCTVTQWQDGERLAVYPADFATDEPIMLPLPAWSER